MYFVSIITVGTLLITGCDNSSIVKDNAPPQDSQITSQLGAAQVGKVAGNRYIVMFKEQPNGVARAQAAGQAVEQTNTVLSALSIPQDSLIHQYKWASYGFAGRFSSEQVKKLRQHPLVDHVVKDFYYKAVNYIPAVTLPAITGLLSSGSQTTPWGGQPGKWPFKWQWQDGLDYRYRH